VKGNRVRTVTALSLLGIIALAAISWFLVLSPRLSKADEIALEVEQVEAANLQLRNRLNQTKDLVTEAPAAAAEAQVLFAKMPEAAELPTVLRQITDAAERAGMKPDDVQVISTTVPVAIGESSGAAGVGLASMQIDVTVEGTRPQLLAFLDSLQELDRALLVDATQITAAAEPAGKGGETLQAGGTMFVLQSALPDLVAQVEQLITEAGAAAAESGT
jgi:Tfp pilus assembly protein PilO